MSNSTTPGDQNHAQKPWYSEMSKYHWIVFAVCSLGWAFDCMDQHLFTAIRATALTDLMAVEQGGLPVKPDDLTVNTYATYATFIMIIGWATGGIIFGIIGDKFGRARTMIFTILIYSLLTGLSAFTHSFWDFVIIRFFAGVGIGGQFAVGASLLAETVPSRARPHVLGLMQAMSSLGNITAALVVLSFNNLALLEVLPLGNSVWRCIFLFGSVPALLAYFVIRYLKEPESWHKQVSSPEGRKNAGSVRELFGNPTLRKHVILGMILASTGVIGAWGIGMFTNELARGIVFKDAQSSEIYLTAEKEILDKHSIPADQKENAPAEVREEMKKAANAAVRNDKNITNEAVSRTGWNLLILNIGAFFGMYGFTLGAVFWGRRLTFTIFMTGCILSVCATFLLMDTFMSQVILVPIMGFFTMSMFGGYTIYFPELFPTRLRSTGVSFCYNVGRYIAAFGPLVLGALISGVFSSYGEIDPTLPLRYAGATMSTVFIIGIIVIWFLPETKGKPLPE